MGLADDVAASTRHAGGYCTVGDLFHSRPDLADDLRDLLYRRDDRGRWAFSANVLSRALAKNDVRIAYYTLNRHRNAECACPT